MTKLSLDQLRPGMRLAADLQSDMGRFLLAKGTELDDSHMRIMRIWGVTAVEVESEEKQDQTPEAPPAALATAQEIMRLRLRLNDLEYPAIKELFRLCSSRLVRSINLNPNKAKAFLSNKPSGSSSGVLEKLEGKYRSTPEAILGSGDVTLASLPAFLSELVDIINNPRCSALEIARVVERDTTLTARLLRIVNSPFYGFPSKVDTISRAVTVIGSRQLTTLAMGVAAIHSFQDIPEELVDMRDFWRHSLMCGFACRILASYTNTPNSERFFVSGLLHDIGRLALYKNRPRESAEVLATARALRESSERVERKLFGFDHGALGGHLLKTWNFPLVLENSVRYHHSPMGSPSFRETAMVHFSDVLAWALDQDGLETVVPPLNATVWESLGLPAVSLSAVVEQLEFLYNQTARYFLGDE
ncbi:HDOD domain-containing protein [Desulfocurvibacter africanus]|nr:HDOD domain-containing protein [Desulfocurvibacter africanus]